MDSAGNVYVVGGASAGFPITSGAFQNSCSAPTTCAFLAKLNAAGSALSYATYVGSAQARAVAVNSLQNAHFAGEVEYPTFPEVNSLQPCALAVSNTTVTGDFSMQNNCTTEAPAGGTCAISVIFTPTAVGTRNGVLTITDSSAGSPCTVQLTGLGGGPMAVPSLSSLSFPAQAVRTSSPAQQITLTNPGAFNLQITRIQASGDFSQTNTCGTSVTIGLSCTISVIYSPTSVGAGSGTLTITDNAANSPQTVVLTGAGWRPIWTLACRLEVPHPLRSQ